MDDKLVDLPETPEEIAAREERTTSARKRTHRAEPKPLDAAEERRKYDEHVAAEAALAAEVQARVDKAQASLIESATPKVAVPDPEEERQRAEEIAAEREEAERVRALGPEPSGVTVAQIADNPSDYKPGIEENRRRALEPTDDERAHHERALEARQRVVDEEHGGTLAALARPAVPPVPVEHVDTRQLWVCVGGDGIRSVTHGELHPAFRSDAHLVGEYVKCPACGESSVRKVDPNEDLRLDEERAIWATMPPHQREQVMMARRVARDATLTAPR